MLTASKQRTLTNRWIKYFGPPRPEALQRFTSSKQTEAKRNQWVQYMNGSSIPLGPYPYLWCGKGWAQVYFNCPNGPPTFCPFNDSDSFTLDVKFGPRGPTLKEPARVNADVYLSIFGRPETKTCRTSQTYRPSQNEFGRGPWVDSW